MPHRLRRCACSHVWRRAARGAALATAGAWLCSARLVLCMAKVLMLPELVPYTARKRRISTLSRYCRSLVRAAAAGQPEQLNNSGASSDGGSGKQSRLRDAAGRFIDSTEEAQPQLQTWLQQEQGLKAADADQHARRLALVFGSQQAALDGLPTTFEWCRSRGLKGSETVQLLDRIALARWENVVQFAALVQPVWQLLDSHIAAYVEPLRQAGARLPKHTSLAGVLCGSESAALALVMPPGHVEAWLAAVGQQLPAAAIGRLLVSLPNVVTGSPATVAAAISWAVNVLGAADPAAFFAVSPNLLAYEVSTLQRNFDSLQQALGWTAEQARQLVLQQPRLLSSSTGTVQVALAWLRQLFPDAGQLAAVIDRGSRLLCCSEQHLQGNADTLRAALGWQDGDGPLAAFVAAYPQGFAIVNFGSEDTQHKLRLLSKVVGVRADKCLATGSNYLKYRLEKMAATYMLVQVRGHVVPCLLPFVHLRLSVRNEACCGTNGWRCPDSAGSCSPSQLKPPHACI